MAITALIDGDWILYAAGFAGQKTKYVQPTTCDAQEFDTLTDLRSNEEYRDDEPIYSRVVIDPPAHIFHSAKNMIVSNATKISERFNEEVIIRVFIDGDGNFRSRLATLRPYKGNRPADSKPKMYNDIRQYLLEAWDAEVVFDEETDDRLTIEQTRYASEGRKSIIVGVDKDYLQCPGWILNPNKGFKHISEQEGRYRLYVQCLTGDTSDNIPGCYKCGPKRAADVVPKRGSEYDMWEAVVREFTESRGRYPEKYPEHMSPRDIALENMRLVYLRRQPEEIWMPPTGKE